MSERPLHERIREWDRVDTDTLEAWADEAEVLAEKADRVQESCETIAARNVRSRERIATLEAALREIVDSFDPYDSGRQASRLAKIASDALAGEREESTAGSQDPAQLGDQEEAV